MRDKGLVRRMSNCLFEMVNPLDKCNTSCVSPILMRALRAEGTGTPGRSILKVKTPVKMTPQQEKMTPQQEKANSFGNILIAGGERENSVRKLDKITFSPFNGVKVIPNRMLDRSQWHSDSECSSECSTPINNQMDVEENNCNIHNSSNKNSSSSNNNNNYDYSYDHHSRLEQL